jgi:hypothetical protein
MLKHTKTILYRRIRPPCADCDPHTNKHSNPYSDGDGDKYTYSDSYEHTYKYTDPHLHSGANEYPNAHTYGNANTNDHQHADDNEYTNGDTAPYFYLVAARDSAHSDTRGPNQGASGRASNG